MLRSPSLRSSSHLTRCALVKSEGKEESPVHPPATESITLATPLSALQSDDSSSSVLSVPSCFPLPPTHQINLEDLALIIGLFLSNIVLSPYPFPLPTRHHLPPVHPPLSGADPPLASWEPSLPEQEKPVTLPLTSVDITPPQPVSQTSLPTLLPPLIAMWTIDHLASPGFLGQLDSPGSDLATTALRTCGLSAALQPSTPSSRFFIYGMLSRCSALSREISPTPDPVPNQNPPVRTMQFEPTTEFELFSAQGHAVKGVCAQHHHGA